MVCLFFAEQTPCCQRALPHNYQKFHFAVLRNGSLLHRFPIGTRRQNDRRYFHTCRDHHKLGVHRTLRREQAVARPWPIASCQCSEPPVRRWNLPTAKGEHSISHLGLKVAPALLSGLFPYFPSIVGAVHRPHVPNCST